MTKILITGNLGYIGAVVAKELKRSNPSCYITGYDSGFFAHLCTQPFNPEIFIDNQLYGDVRDISNDTIKDQDVIVHLAGISNDPIGNQFEDVTRDINTKASISIAAKAAELGVKKFIFASSCSIYGAGGELPKTESDQVEPLTAYAKSKANTEIELQALSSKIQIICLRFATACGWTPRMRLDLVLNDFVTSAYFEKRISILSDGTPWRPLIHVKDMGRAIEWAVNFKHQDRKILALNVGSNKANYQIKDLALSIKEFMPNITIEVNPRAAPDKRSYKVDFSLFEKFAPHHQPLMSLEATINDILSNIGTSPLIDKNFRTSTLIRLKCLQSHIDSGRLSQQLKWNIKEIRES